MTTREMTPPPTIQTIEAMVDIILKLGDKQAGTPGDMPDGGKRSCDIFLIRATDVDGECEVYSETCIRNVEMARELIEAFLK